VKTPKFNIDRLLTVPVEQRSVLCLLFHKEHYKSEPESVFDKSWRENLAETFVQLSPEVALFQQKEIGDENDTELLSRSHCIWIHMAKSWPILKQNELQLFFDKVLDAFGCRLQVGFGKDAFWAYLRCVTNSDHNTPLSEISIETLPAAGNLFGQTNKLRSEDLRRLKLLRDMGVYNFSDFLDFAKMRGLALLGKEALEWLDVLKSGYQKPWPLFRLPETFEERVSFHHLDLSFSDHGLDWILFPLQSLLKRLCLRLEARGLAILQLEFSVGLESYSTTAESNREWKFDLPSPQKDPQFFLTLFKDRLRKDLEIESLSSPVTDMTVKVLKSAVSYFSQTHFFNAAERVKEDRIKFLTRLVQSEGKQSVYGWKFHQGILPEDSWRPSLDVLKMETVSKLSESRDLRDDSLAGGNWSERPTVLLAKPVLLRFHQGVFFCEDTSRRKFEVESFWGPERILANWWSDEVRRDYYWVQARSGARLWIFRTSKAQFYLHGFAD